MVIDPLFKFSLSSFILLMINRLKSIFSVCVCVYIYEFLKERRETETEIQRKRDREKMRKVEGALLIPHVLTSSLFCLHSSCFLETIMLNSIIQFESPKSPKSPQFSGFHCPFWKHLWLFLNILENCTLICNCPMWWEGWWWWNCLSQYLLSTSFIPGTC